MLRQEVKDRLIIPWIHLCRIKIPYPLQWGAPSFDAGHAFGMMAAVLVSLIEVACVYSCHRLEYETISVLM